MVWKVLLVVVVEFTVQVTQDSTLTATPISQTQKVMLTPEPLFGNTEHFQILC
jgi:hypothetical protein